MNRIFRFCTPLFKVLFLYFSICLLLSSSAYAIFDLNENGVSDYWEKQYNSGNLYSNFNPATDPDGDGWNNAQEAEAGTDPGEANPPTGFIRPEIEHIPAVYQSPEENGGEPALASPEAIRIQWPTLIGKTYTLLTSVDLGAQSWRPFGGPRIGTGSILGAEISLTQPDGSIPPVSFLRVAVEDIDIDGDSLTNAEEHAVGSSPYFADTNGNGIPDGLELRGGNNPSAGMADGNGDGIPDNEIYSVEFEVTNENHNLEHVGHEVLTATDNLHRYLTRKSSQEYSLSGSPEYSNIQDGKWTQTDTFLENGALIGRGELTTHYEGVTPSDAYLAHKLPALVLPEHLESDSTQTTVTGPTVSATEILTTTTKTRSWRVKKPVAGQANETVVRSGTETATDIAREKLSDSVTYQQLWTNYVKTIPWTASNASAPYFHGPHAGSMSQARLALGDVVVAENVRDFFRNGNFDIGGTVSNPSFRRIDYSLTNVNYRVTDGRLKSLRWRWVRFNPLTPFDYEYAAPPSSYQKTFRLLVQQKNTTYLQPGYTPATDETIPKGIIEIDCKGSEGTGWHTVSPSKYAAYKVEEPASQATLDFTKSGESEVSFGNFPIDIVSRDKYLAGSIRIPISWNDFGMEFVGPDGSLGKYGKLLGGGTTKIYDKVEDILADSDYAAGGQAATQKVWFVRDSNDARKINYYTCFDSLGDVHIKLYLNGKPEPLGDLVHTLTAAQDFAAVIDYVDHWVKGTSFDFSGGVVTPPLAMRGMNTNATGVEAIHNFTRAALIPFFNVINNVEGLGNVAFGLFDGVKAGVGDDWKLLVLIKSGVLGAGGWAIESAEEELTKWRDDPLKRAAELKKAADQLCQDWVLKPMEQLQADLSTWEGFKNRGWRAWDNVKGTSDKVWVLTKDSWSGTCSGISEWMEDFGARMIEGAEKTHWSEHVLAMDKFQQIANAATITGCYALGYCTGYIAEQVVVGLLTDGTVKIGAVLTKGGVTLAGRLAARRVLPVVARLHFVKKWAASAAVPIEMKAAVERGLIIAAESPLSLVVKDSTAEVIERGMKRATFERTAFSSSRVLDEVIAAITIKKLILTPGREGQFWYKFALFFDVMGEKATAPASKGWVKAYNRLLKFNGDVIEDDRAEDLLNLFKAKTSVDGKIALEKSLEEFGATDGTGKLWFRDVEKIQAEGYRYSNFDPRFDRDGNLLAGEPKLSTVDEPSGGWYTSFDKFDGNANAKSSMQLPPESTAKYRLEFDYAAVKEKVRVPRGQHQDADFFEPLCKDFPQYGTGNSTQVIVEGVDVPIKAIWDISGTSPIQIYPQ